MKYLLVIAVVFVAYWIWREGRRNELNSHQPPRPRGGSNLPPQEMTRCAQCGLHLPLAEAVSGRRSLHYCCDAHRNLAER